MINYLKYGRRYLLYLINARTKYSIHSPFVFNFIEKVLQNKTMLPEFEAVEVERRKLLSDPAIFIKTDFGTGGGNKKQYKTRISDIARKSLMPRKRARQLFRMIRYFQFMDILEIGTSLGITTSYLALAEAKGNVTSLEGCPNLTARAGEIFKALKIDNINLITGPFEASLRPCLEQMEKADFILFDGNHSFGATIDYFETCLPYIHNNSLFVFDDIHWSEEMEVAWERIKTHEKVRVTIDLFHCGLVFFKRELHPQHFVIRY